jgi:hypothetical protein
MLRPDPFLPSKKTTPKELTQTKIKKIKNYLTNNIQVWYYLFRTTITTNPMVLVVINQEVISIRKVPKS